MKNIVSRCAACVVLFFATASSHGLTLTFEDLNPAPAAYDVMPSPYNGLTFSGWFYGPETVYTPASGTIDLFTDYADPNDPGAFVITNGNNRITSGTPFVFDGAWFSGYSGVTFQLSLGANLVHTSATLPDSPGADPYLPTFLASGYAGQVDKVVVSGVQGYYAMDDFTFRAVAASVPEPSMYLLMLAGLATIASVRRVVREDQGCGR